LICQNKFYAKTNYTPPQPQTPTALQIRSNIERVLSGEFLDVNQAERYIKRILNNKIIQSQIDKFGDKILGEWIELKFPYTNGNNKSQDKIHNLLKSNWYLNRRYKEMGFLMKPYSFSRELNYRYWKREASLLEWIIGLIFMISKEKTPYCPCQKCGNLRNPAERAIHLVNLYLENKIFTIIKPENREELEKTLAEFEMYQLSKKEEAAQ
jgi:hypothetical protein